MIVELLLISKIDPFEVQQLEKRGYHGIRDWLRRWLDISIWRQIWKSGGFSQDISKLKRLLRLIFYSFEVLISTIELQNMNRIGPLEMKIAMVMSLWSAGLVESQPTTAWVCPGQISLAECSTDQKINFSYLHHQRSDSVHTLQFDSTDEYFESTEYEPQRPLELRDILWNPPDFQNCLQMLTSSHLLDQSLIPWYPRFSSCWTWNGSILELRRSSTIILWLWVTN